ncbi:MAG: hypothetical protein AMJ75_06715 [Phycisphaerae bacterium SM1_79]|nr:MAG: hypothetical protein AMJ75_06715 [Phycisphaerae bacterium SM1_79]
MLRAQKAQIEMTAIRGLSDNHTFIAWALRVTALSMLSAPQRHEIRSHTEFPVRLFFLQSGCSGLYFVPGKLRIGANI